MDAQLLKIFQLQIVSQCGFSMRAFRDAKQSLDNAQQQKAEEVFYSIQAFITSASNVSRALWGAGNARISIDRQPLRDSLGVLDTSPLSNFKMRHNFEHFDERILAWWEESTSHNYVDLNIMSPGVVQGFAPKDCFRNIDPVSLELTFWGEPFNILEVFAEILRINKAAYQQLGLPRGMLSPQ